MKIYHAELTTEALLQYRKLHPTKPLRALVSYGRQDKHLRNMMFDLRGQIDGLIMDSGTWTLNCNPKKYAEIITFGGYKAYMKILSHKFDFYFNFDADFSKEGFETNFSYQIDLEKEGLNPVPVVHDCYSDEIKTYIDRGHKQIAIGSGELKFAGLDELRHIVHPLYRSGVKVHFLGCTQYKKLAYLPVYSADSTTWTRTGSAGRIFYWNPLKIGYNKLDKIALDDDVPKNIVHIRDYMFRRHLEEYLHQELGLSVGDLMGNQKFLNRELVNIHYFVLLEELINAKHREQGFTFK